MDVPNRSSQPASVPLADLRKGDRGVVAEVLETDAGIAGDAAGATIGRRLIEIGFVPGELVQVIEEVWPGGDPMAVRVGSSVFALRRREARAVLVRPGATVAAGAAGDVGT
jgi:ferrous iron transport protein A